MRHKAVRKSIIEHMAQLRIAISDHELTEEDCHLLKANCEAMMQLLDRKCRQAAKSAEARSREMRGKQPQEPSGAGTPAVGRGRKDVAGREA